MPNQFVSINNTKIDSASGRNLTVDSFTMSPIEVDNITLQGFRSNLHYNNSRLVNASIRFLAEIDLNWYYGFCIDYIIDEECVGDSGSTRLVDYTSPWLQFGNLGLNPGNLNIGMPFLSFKLQGNSIKISPSTTEPKISSQDLDVNQIKVDEIVLPGSLPAIFGGGGIPITNPLEPQDISVANTSIKELESANVRLPPFSLENLQITNMNLNNLEAGGFQAGGYVESTAGIDAGYFGVGISVKVTTELRADKLLIDNASGTMSANQADFSNMNLSISLKDIQIQNLKFSQYRSDEVELGI